MKQQHLERDARGGQTVGRPHLNSPRGRGIRRQRLCLCGIREHRVPGFDVDQAVGGTVGELGDLHGLGAAEQVAAGAVDPLDRDPVADFEDQGVEEPAELHRSPNRAPVVEPPVAFRLDVAAAPEDVDRRFPRHVTEGRDARCLVILRVVRLLAGLVVPTAAPFEGDLVDDVVDGRLGSR